MVNISVMLDICRYIIKTPNATLRKAAKEFNIPKSTIHKNIHTKVSIFFPIIYVQVCDKLERNFKFKHINGGKSTAQRWKERRKQYENIK